MRHRLTVGCENVIIDQETNKVSFINIIGDVTAAKFPVIFQSFSVTSVFEKEEGDDEIIVCDFRLNLGEEELTSGSFEVNFSNNAELSRNVLTFIGLALPRPGKFEAAILRNNVFIASWDFEVRQS